MLLGPTHVFHKAGHHLIQQEQGYVIEHFAKAPSDTTIHAVLLAHRNPKPLSPPTYPVSNYVHARTPPTKKLRERWQPALIHGELVSQTRHGL